MIAPSTLSRRSSRPTSTRFLGVARFVSLRLGSLKDCQDARLKDAQHLSLVLGWVVQLDEVGGEANEFAPKAPQAIVKARPCGDDIELRAAEHEIAILLPPLTLRERDSEQRDLPDLRGILRRNRCGTGHSDHRLMHSFGRSLRSRALRRERSGDSSLVAGPHRLRTSAHARHHPSGCPSGGVDQRRPRQRTECHRRRFGFGAAGRTSCTALSRHAGAAATQLVATRRRGGGSFAGWLRVRLRRAPRWPFDL